MDAVSALSRIGSPANARKHVTHQKREREAIRDGVVHAEYDDRALGTMQQRGAQQRRS
jgi:hypothetical protein